MKVPELRIELRKREIALSVNKPILLEWLIDTINKNLNIIVEEGDIRGRQIQQQNQANLTVNAGSCWEYVEADGDILEESFAMEEGMISMHQ